MSYFRKPITFLLFGFAVGTTVGYFAAPSREQRYFEGVLPLNLPRDFFASLPMSDDGKHRIVEVEEYMFLGDEGPLNYGETVTLPLFMPPPESNH